MLTLIAITATAGAAEFDLVAGTTTIIMPDSNEPVVMWGFGLAGGDITVPGPRLTLDPGDDQLIIHLTNNLPEPTSIVIPGQLADLQPVKFADDQGRDRVRSFTQETAPTQTVTYEWNGLRPGTYQYHSGTHPAVQVQMGLYGVITRDASAGSAYAGHAYTDEVVLVYSEVDPVLHDAVAAGTYGVLPGPTSTVDYQPKYFLVNGAPHSAASAPVPAGAPGAPLLLRLVNCGLRTHAPMLLGADMTVVAQDGYPRSYPQRCTTLLLPAGQTLDVIVVPPTLGAYPIFDRTLCLTNAGYATPGGMLSILNVATAPQPPETVASDGFESGNFSGGLGWLSAAWTATGDAIVYNNTFWAHTGQYSARLRRSTGYLERAVNLTDVSSAHLKFWARVWRLEGADQVLVRVSSDGVNYVTVHTFTAADNGVYQFYDIDLSAFPMTADFRVVFDAAMNSTGDYFYVDDVVIEGVVQ